jgi:Dolichyl-phosphate-mannose-protein mannosyltransferase
VLLALTLVLQVRSGAYQSDFGGHPDEAAHVVTGLMVRDYLAGPVWSGTHPMRYAEEYYERFPRVALGHYPPGFYVVEGLWLLPSRTATAALLLPAFLTAFTAWVIFMAGRGLMGSPSAFVAAVLFPLMHLVQVYTAIVMSDMLLVIWCLLAALAFSRFLVTGEAKWSLAFGLLAAAAILTKGSGLLLALVPPVAIVLTARWRILLAPKLWLAPLPVIFLAVPWLLMTAHITAEGMSAAPFGEYVLEAIPYYAAGGFDVLGKALIILVGVALVGAARCFRQDKALPASDAVLWALILAVFGFYCAVPSGLDERYLLPAIPPVLILGFAALDRLSLGARAKFPRLPAFSLVAAVALVVGWETYAPAIKVFHGATQAVTGLLRATDEPLALLVCSDANGEGALVAAAAILAPDRIVVQRGTKLLSTSDWLGRGYVANFSNEEELFSLLKDAAISHTIIDEGVPQAAVWPHQLAVSKAIQSQPDRLRPVTEVPARRRDMRSQLTIAEFED